MRTPLWNNQERSILHALDRGPSAFRCDFRVETIPEKSSEVQVNFTWFQRAGNTRWKVLSCPKVQYCPPLAWGSHSVILYKVPKKTMFASREARDLSGWTSANRLRLVIRRNQYLLYGKSRSTKKLKKWLRFYSGISICPTGKKSKGASLMLNNFAIAAVIAKQATKRPVPFFNLQ